LIDLDIYIIKEIAINNGNSFMVIATEKHNTPKIYLCFIKYNRPKRLKKTYIISICENNNETKITNGEPKYRIFTNSLSTVGLNSTMIFLITR
jgi:hypothetical protein